MLHHTLRPLSNKQARGVWCWEGCGGKGLGLCPLVMGFRNIKNDGGVSKKIARASRERNTIILTLPARYPYIHDHAQKNGVLRTPPQVRGA